MCAADPECGGCAGVVPAWGGWEAAELFGCGGGGGRGRGGGAGCPSSGDSRWGGGPPATRCERIGVAVCRRHAASTQEQEAEEGEREEGEREDGEEGGVSMSRRAEACLGNRVAQALLTCRVRTAGCKPEDAPCIKPPEEQRRGGEALLSADLSNRDDSAELAPRPLSEDVERGGRARGLPAAGAVDDVDPELAAGATRGLLILPGEITCDGILEEGACCSDTCGDCGGAGCSDLGSIASECCSENILESGIRCADTGGEAPCIVFGKG